jgi:TrpR-related protein YerC/YecD
MNEKTLQSLYKAITKLESTSECAEFFRDLCTVNELKAMSERWEVAQKVNKGTPYRQIAEETGASTATITRVAHWLHHGMGGYQHMLKKLSKAKS